MDTNAKVSPSLDRHLFGIRGRELMTQPSKFNDNQGCDDIEEAEKKTSIWMDSHHPSADPQDITDVQSQQELRKFYLMNNGRSK